MAGVIALDVFGQITLISKSLQAGTKQTPERLFSCVFPLVRVKLRLGEETLSTAFTEQLVISCMPSHVTH